jgi:antitoxin (DNA-binding transcriptional repressor) of toxin-antitoxin stability system
VTSVRAILSFVRFKTWVTDSVDSSIKYESLLNMKTANVRQLRHHFGSVLDWIADGQQVEIVKKGKVIAVLSPPPRKSTKFKLPDFEARRKRIFGGRIIPGNIVAEERESYPW